MKAGSTKKRRGEEATTDLGQPGQSVNGNVALRADLGRYVFVRATQIHGEAITGQYGEVLTPDEGETLAGLIAGLLDFSGDLGVKTTARGVATEGSGAPLSDWFRHSPGGKVAAAGLRVVDSAEGAIRIAVDHHRRRADVLSGEVEQLSEKVHELRASHATITKKAGDLEAENKALRDALHREAEAKRSAR